jgi:hypothetical protein
MNIHQGEKMGRARHFNRHVITDTDQHEPSSQRAKRYFGQTPAGGDSFRGGADIFANDFSGLINDIGVVLRALWRAGKTCREGQRAARCRARPA